MVEYISNYINISEGTYILFKKVSKRGLCKYLFTRISRGPPRKYYEITKEGLKAYEELVREWEDFTVGVNKILRGDFSE